ncbi:MAG: glycosyltransferase family 4 protein [Methanomassiliicoccus sp.]|nr:glycosyltransferase family 4 protein [Methanomassiliicoccus sp.]
MLLFNWRDIKNPQAGGAEVYTHQIMKRLVERGHEVTIFSSMFEGGLKEERIDGITVVRSGSRYSVYRRAGQFYNSSKVRYDVVIDEINTVPFMTPRFVTRGERIVALIHQLAREFWYYEMPYPVAWMGYNYFERKWLSRYRDIQTVTVSDSTRNELLEMGFKNVIIVPNGLNVTKLDKVPPKTSHPSMIFVGRMKKAKCPHHVVEAYRILKQRFPDLTLVAAGDGYLRSELQKANPDIEFLGYVDRETRDSRVRESWVIAVPGVREGWGQVVTDANALGTPAVGYNIPGLRDSIKDGYNGLLTPPTPVDLSNGIARLLGDERLRMEMGNNGLEWAGRFSWDVSADAFEKLLKS